MAIEVRPLTGSELEPAIPALAELRVTVFADFPYLYDGSPQYEARYLQTYADSADAIVVAAIDDGRIVGAATGSPMADHHGEFADAFRHTQKDLARIFYCAESVLLPQYRGLGIGHAFFDHREAHARRLGHQWSAFCAVIRPDGHPARPADYRPLDGFWRKRGYEMLPGAIATFRWKDHGDADQTDHQLQFWLRKLDNRP
jgi:GNAT superfamily N-acetyltransferase